MGFLCLKTRDSNEKKIDGFKFCIGPDPFAAPGMGGPVMASTKIPFNRQRRRNYPGSPGIENPHSFPSALFEYPGGRRIPSQFIPETAQEILPSQTSKTKTQGETRTSQGCCSAFAPTPGNWF